MLQGTSGLPSDSQADDETEPTAGEADNNSSDNDSEGDSRSDPADSQDAEQPTDSNGGSWSALSKIVVHTVKMRLISLWCPIP